MYCVLHGVRGIIAIVRNERGNCAVLLSIIAGRIVRTDQKATSAFKSQEANGIPKQWRISCLYSCNGKLRNRNHRMIFGDQQQPRFFGREQANVLSVVYLTFQVSCFSASFKQRETIFDLEMIFDVDYRMLNVLNISQEFR